MFGELKAKLSWGRDRKVEYQVGKTLGNRNEVSSTNHA
jgi:hypothetical protein